MNRGRIDTGKKYGVTNFGIVRKGLGTLFLAAMTVLQAMTALRQKYLACVHEFAEKWLDWNRLDALVESQQKMIAGLVDRDTRKHHTTEAFTTGVYGDGTTPPPPSTIKGFADQRREYLLGLPSNVKSGDY